MLPPRPPPPSLAPAHGAAAAAGVEQQREEEQQEEQQAQLNLLLLQLPDFLLQLILARLTAASDLAACAASCRALLGQVSGASWRQVTRFHAPRWTPALPGSLAWAASHCPQLAEVDLSGASACCDADLLPLAQLTSLTSLCLEGLWQVTGSSSGSSISGSRSAGHRRRGGGTGSGPAAAGSGQPLDLLAAILRTNRGLLALDLSGTAVPVSTGLAAALALLTSDAPNATKAAHGLQQLRLAGCRRAAGGQQQQQLQDALREVLVKCPTLTCLDLAGCQWVTGGALPQSGDALSAALSLLPLRHGSFSGCGLLGGIGWLVSCWHHLESLELAATGVDDADVELIAGGCHRLQSLDLSGCCRIKGPALLSLAASPAVQLGCLTTLKLAELAWVGQQHLAPLLRTLSTAAESALSLDLSSCGGLNDASLLELLPPPAAGQAAAGQAAGGEPGCSRGGSADDSGCSSCTNHRRVSSSGGNNGSGGNSGGSGSGYCIGELLLGGSSRLTAAALLQLAAATLAGQGADKPLLLRRLRHLDVSHVQCLSSKGSSGGGGAASSAAAQALAALLAAAGSSLITLSLDGCFAGSGLLPHLARHCPAVRQLSVVGCSGVGDADLAALTGLRQLRQLAVGGASLAWHEHHALTGLTGLTRLRIARRPFLTDAQLAPLLAANRSSLLQLELAGCAGLTDRVLLHLLVPPAPPAAATAATAAMDGPAPPPLPPLPQQQQHEGQQDGETEGGGPPPPQQQQNQQQVVEQQQGREREQEQAASPPPPALRHLQLACCERVTGGSLRQLPRLRSLRLAGCPAITQAAVQAATICCTRLTLLELPSHIPAGSLPVAPAGAASHLRGLQVLGGLDERGGGRSGGGGGSRGSRSGGGSRR